MKIKKNNKKKKRFVSKKYSLQSFNFRKTTNMLNDNKKLIYKLRSFGEILNVPDNGSCGYYSIHLGLQTKGKTNLLKQLEISYLRQFYCFHVKDLFNKSKDNDILNFLSLILIKKKNDRINRFCYVFMKQKWIIKRKIK